MHSNTLSAIAPISMRLIFLGVCVCSRACACVRACLLQAYRGALLTAAQAVGYEEAKKLFVSSPAIAADPSNLATHLAASMLAGLVSTTAVRTPFSCSLAAAALSSNFFFWGGWGLCKICPFIVDGFFRFVRFHCLRFCSLLLSTHCELHCSFHPIKGESIGCVENKPFCCATKHCY